VCRISDLVNFAFHVVLELTEHLSLHEEGDVQAELACLGEAQYCPERWLIAFAITAIDIAVDQHMQRTCPRTAGSFYLNLRASARVAHEDLGDDAPSPERTPDQGVEVRLPKFGRNFILDRRRFLPEGDCADQCHAVDSFSSIRA
jgi:hypothetical protein